jgi:DNA polymerase
VSEKIKKYEALVKRRKLCDRCAGLINPARILGGVYDSNQIGPWSIWQGNLDAKLLIVGQDWGCIDFYQTHKGEDPVKNSTNNTLIDLLKLIGINIYPPQTKNAEQIIFLTNAILCMKDGAMQSQVYAHWYDNCSEFLRESIIIVNPEIVITLGEKAYRAISSAFRIKPVTKFKDAVEMESGFPLTASTRLFPVYHCGRRILNTHRKIDVQKKTGRKLGATFRLEQCRG